MINYCQCDIVHIGYQPNISQKNKHWIISDFISNLRYKRDNKQPNLLHCFCSVRKGDCGSHSSTPGGDTTDIDAYSMFE